MRTVLFGLDGATYNVLDPLLERGVMPNLQRLREQGVRCELESTPLPITPQAWTTLATGRSMGHHGIHDFVRVERTDAGVFLRFNTARDRQVPTLWRTLSDHGKRVTALNYFGLAPAEPVNGHTMPGFVPGRYLKRSSYPPDLFARLEKVPHFDVSVLGLDLDIEREGLAEMPPERWFEWISLHIERERAWFSALEYLMTHEPSDLTAIVFDGVDKIQHLAYRYLDPRCRPAKPTAWETQVIDLCDQYFRQIDDFLGRTLEIVGPWGRVFIASDHGFTACREIVYINKYLHDLGHLTWSGEVAEDQSESIVVERLTKYMGVYDWSRTRAAALTPSCNGIYILNVPPAEYHAFRERLISELLALRGSDGCQVITEIKKREEWFAGPWMGRAPDLTLTLRDHGFLSVLNAAQPVIDRTAPVGTHHPQGVLWGVGPGLKRNATVERCNILDMASLLTHSVGLEIPAEYEGKFPAALYEESYLSSDPPRVAWSAPAE
ncbi:MAG: alkaline phosphatase family protein, partial [Planctomycetaceae bacterium]|nr:alkaline phosphatase family protein [Planctomycetaceae bacterium]